MKQYGSLRGAAGSQPRGEAEIERVFEFHRMLVTTAQMKISLSLIFVCGLK